jgi:hypothetical protein
VHPPLAKQEVLLSFSELQPCTCQSSDLSLDGSSILFKYRVWPITPSNAVGGLADILSQDPRQLQDTRLENDSHSFFL